MSSRAEDVEGGCLIFEEDGIEKELWYVGTSMLVVLVIGMK